MHYVYANFTERQKVVVAGGGKRGEGPSRSRDCF